MRKSISKHSGINLTESVKLHARGLMHGFMMRDTRRLLFAICLIIGSCAVVTGQSPSGVEYNLLIGTYTKPGKSEGIYVYRFNSDTGKSTYKSKATGIQNPSYLTVSKDRKHVYSVNEIGDGKGGVSSFSFDPAAGQLQFMNSTGSGGDGPCYISVDDKNRFVFVGNYDGGSISAIPIRPDGALGSSIQSINHQGKGVAPEQDRSHVHAAVLSPDNQFLFVPDLGTDKVNIYNVALSSVNPLTPASSAFQRVRTGSGPRHFTFHPNGRYAYVIQELTGDITGFAYSNGRLKQMQEVSLPSTAHGSAGADAADIHVSPDGRFLYGSLRGDINELVYCAIDGEGKLTYAGRTSTLGRAPRNFVIDPTGKFLLVANGGSDEIIIFRRDQHTGALTFTGEKIAIGSPVCLKLVSID